MFNIKALEKLNHELKKLPGVGPKTAQRLSYYILKSPSDSKKLQEALLQVQTVIRSCPICHSYTDQETCNLCLDPKRNNDIICVVEDPFDIVRIESSNVFKGRYHVLHGTISPLDGVGPDDLRIIELEKKLIHGLPPQGSPIEELIFALDSDLEGDTTVVYLSQRFAQYKVKMTRLAQGIPIGSDIDYVDYRTMGRAIENRMVL